MEAMKYINTVKEADMSKGRLPRKAMVSVCSPADLVEAFIGQPLVESVELKLSH